jgi:hypothetical protein
VAGEANTQIPTATRISPVSKRSHQYFTASFISLKIVSAIKDIFKRYKSIFPTMGWKNYFVSKSSLRNNILPTDRMLLCNDSFDPLRCPIMQSELLLFS